MITGTILGTEENEHKNIIIWICFESDGVEVPFYKGTELITFNGKNAWPLYSRFQNFAGKSEAEVAEWIRINVEHQAGNLILVEKHTSVNDPIRATISKLVGTKHNIDSVEIAVDKPDTTITISTDIKIPEVK